MRNRRILCGVLGLKTVQHACRGRDLMSGCRRTDDAAVAREGALLTSGEALSDCIEMKDVCRCCSG
jgi:hypothetical protein